jgi:hypothetical protein
MFTIQNKHDVIFQESRFGVANEQFLVDVTVCKILDANYWWPKLLEDIMYFF